MLRIRFLNVGDGDAILIEEIDGGTIFRMLVDCGRDIMEDDPKSLTCAEHLVNARVQHIDKMLITHLHTDHSGGLDGVMSKASIDELMASFIPYRPGQQIPEMPNAQKTVRGMITCVNQWSSNVSAARAFGCKITEITETTNYQLTDRLFCTITVPDATGTVLQKRVWNGMANGKRFSENEMVRASKLRNPNSLRVRLNYAGRSIELGADCYGYEWENEPLEACDLFKLPHHGDAKSITDSLIEKLRPAHAIISCGRDYIPRKDRPSDKTLHRLQRIGAHIWFTDAYSDGRTPAIQWSSVDFSILEDGRIVPPAKTRTERTR